jgi:hypothetical protein
LPGLIAFDEMAVLLGFLKTTQALEPGANDEV